MSREWQQIRLRLPDDLLMKIRDAADRKGTSIQQELLVRIQKGSAARPSTAAAELGRIAGQVDAARALHESLGAVLVQLNETVSQEAE